MATLNANPKIAIIHDFLIQYGGAERSLETLKEIFPEATIFTLLYDKKKLPQYKDWDIRTSYLQKFPLWKKNHYIYFPFYQNAIETFKLEDFDIILSNSVNYAKGVKTKGKLHISYCYTPPRFVYIMKDKYLLNKNLLLRQIMLFFINIFKKWDLKTKNNPDFYIAISSNVKNRIKEYYQIQSEIIYPPIDTSFFKPDSQTKKENFYLVVSRFKEYKNLTIAVDCFNKRKDKLKIVGQGNSEKTLRIKANNNIKFLSDIDDKALLSFYRKAQAVIITAEEDLGLVSLEAQASGAPVIALGKGGSLETVIDGKTGVFFYEETYLSLNSAIERFEKIEFNPSILRENALKFDKEIFKRKIKDFVYSKHKNI